MQLDALATCAELTNEHADAAAHSAESFRAFLAWAAEIARPGEGAPKVLMAIARLAHADWVDGSPYVEIRGDESSTTLSIFADHGMGIRERVAPLAHLRVSFDEFARAVRLAPQLAAPFESDQIGDALYLTPPGMTPGVTEESEHQDIRIDERSLYVQGSKAVPSSDSRIQKTPGRIAAPPPAPDQSGLHTHPTVRRMVAVRPEAFRSENGDD
jgi:hypothetical protein